MFTGMAGDLEHSRACYDRGAWDEAFEALRLADQATPLGCDDLKRLGIAAYLIGGEDEFATYFDRLHHAQLEQGDREQAARTAFWLGLTLLFRGEVALSNAWIARGQRLVENVDCVEHGYLLLPRIELILREGKAAEAKSRAATATAIGERFGDADLAAMARHVEGRALIDQSEVGAGLDILDETMLSVIGGELTPMTTGLMYCSVLEVCNKVHALGRAREWTYAFGRWCDRQTESLAFSDLCFVHRAEVRQSHGEWAAALEDACRACDRAVRSSRKPPGVAVYRRAEIHRLRGEFTEAEEAYREASQLGYDPQPGLALLRVAQGQTESASAAIRRVLHTTRESKRARLLPSFVDIMLAAGEIAEAREGARELGDLAKSLDADALAAAAAQAEGSVELAEGKPNAAVGPLRRAFELWTNLDVPYEAARVRELIARACHALHDEETARLELSAARVEFERLSARADLARVDRESRAISPKAQTTLSPREQQVLRLIADGATNKAIAGRLSVSERTVDRHVSNILVKLDVPSRAAAIAFAYEHGLL